MGLPVASVAPQFNVEVAGRNIWVTGAADAVRGSRDGGTYVLLDMQGRVLRRGAVDGANFAIPVARAGEYLVRIGDRVRRVSVK